MRLTARSESRWSSARRPNKYKNRAI